MKLATSIIVVVAVILLHVSADRPHLWPMPQSWTRTSEEYYIPTNFQFVDSTSQNSSIILLEQAFSRYEKLISKTDISSSLEAIKQLNVTISNPQVDTITFGVDESYTLIIQAPDATLKAPTVFGAMHGLETFSQLIRQGVLPGGVIQDAPRFPWRGLLLDTSRHYQSLESIREIIRGLSYDKMNVFHWHMSDGQSFPYQSAVHPDLTKGAYCKQCIYTIPQIKDIISYANSYGVRVIVEFDMPSHAGPSWGKGYPYLTMNCSEPICNTFGSRYADKCGNFPFDPTNEKVYEFLETFLAEVSSVFPDQYLHMGGDEVKTNCWNVPEILSWMEEHQIYTFKELEQYFLDRVQQYAIQNKKIIVNWEEVFTSGFQIQPGTVVEVWKSFNTLNSVARAGYPALLAYGWYLDHLDTTWQQFYENDPNDGSLTSEQQKLLYGGEGCMWAEKVDETNMQAKIWPRLSATAEVLWSDHSVKGTPRSLTMKRLSYQRCRFYNRGLSGSPIAPGPPCSEYLL